MDAQQEPERQKYFNELAEKEIVELKESKEKLEGLLTMLTHHVTKMKEEVKMNQDRVIDYEYVLMENEKLTKQVTKLMKKNTKLNGEVMKRLYRSDTIGLKGEMLDRATDRIEELKEENKKLKEKLKHNVDWRERAKMEEEEEGN